jgi:hypothetical protein
MALNRYRRTLQRVRVEEKSVTGGSSVETTFNN